MSIRTITDDAATTARIVDALHWLIESAQAGDSLLFQWSGHGSQMVTVDYDAGLEPDGLDEVIVPVDMDWRTNVIRDSDFAGIFGSVPDGVNLTVILDCCHSGSGLRTFYPEELRSPSRIRAIDAPADVLVRAAGLELPTRKLGLERVEQRGLLLSGCRSDQTSADAWIQPLRKWQGALTANAVSVLRANPTATYGRLLDVTRAALAQQGYEQVPQLEAPPGWVDVPFLGVK
jgi:hypothetical protein